MVRRLLERAPGIRLRLVPLGDRADLRDLVGRWFPGVGARSTDLDIIAEWLGTAEERLPERLGELVEAICADARAARGGVPADRLPGEPGRGAPAGPARGGAGRVRQRRRGAVFLGVADDGRVTGVPRERLDLLERWVLDVANDGCVPPIRPLVRRMALPGDDAEDRFVLLVEVPRGLGVHRTARGRTLVRVGSTKRDLTPDELARLFQDRGRSVIFDEQPVPAARLPDLDTERLERFLGRSTVLPWEHLLRNTRVVVPHRDGVDRPTVAGLLAFGTAPQRFLPGARIDAAIYRGRLRDSDALVDARTIDGTVDAQIDEAVAWVDRHMFRPARKGVGREDHPQYDLGVVHEAVVNAVAHRDYALHGAKIRLFLFDDRLKLYSPGGLPNTMTVEEMPWRVYTRNQLLVHFLSRMRSRRTGRACLESRGEGVQRILREGRRHSGRTPEYRLVGPELVLTVWAAPSPHDKE